MYVDTSKFRARCKHSYGIALCRSNRLTGEPEVLMCRKRVTYEFAEFVYGRYYIDDVDKLNKLLNSMTCYEKILLKTKDFDKIWWHLTLQQAPPYKLGRKFADLIELNSESFMNLIDNSSTVNLYGKCQKVGLVLMKIRGTQPYGKHLKKLGYHRTTMNSPKKNAGFH